MNTKGNEGRYIAVIGTVFVFIIVVLFLNIVYNIDVKQPVEEKLKKFNSYDELKKFLKENSEVGSYGYGMAFAERTSVADAGTVVKAAGESAPADDYSKTNIQVEGVDEPDIVKNDGKYIYSVVGNKVVIVEAFPVETMKVVSEIEFKDNKYVKNIFINGDKLAVFVDGWEQINKDEYNKRADGAASGGSNAAESGMIIGDYPGGYSKAISYIYIYDISDRNNPRVENEIGIEGNYQNARMIDNYVYIITNNYVYINNPVLPIYRINGVEKRVEPSDIYYFDYIDNGYSFSSIGAVNLDNGEFNSKIYLLGQANNLYVSEDNIYLAGLKMIDGRVYLLDSFKEVIIPLLPDEKGEEVRKILDSDKSLNEKLEEVNRIVEEYSKTLIGEEKADFDKKLYDGLREFDLKVKKDREKSAIHKINVNEEKIEYKGSGEVSGHILNQFSMDEFNGYFRIATTVGEVWEGNSVNNIYVLDSDLRIIGKLEDLARGEKIYSARFIGDRAYLVTFKKIDPFFVIDLSNVREPRVLGYLKIPGYSDYLHPYDENHIIGIGKEAVDASESETAGRNLDFAWYQGLKIAIFDVSDVVNPKESAKIVIGDRGTDSYALSDHKAFLFDKKRNLLVLPVSLAEIDKTKYTGEIPANAYGEIVWQGAYVLDIKENEIKVKGKISHFDDVNKTGEGYYGYYGAETIQRSLYMDNVLYTISQKKIKANELQDLREVGRVGLPFEGDSGGFVAY